MPVYNPSTTLVSATGTYTGTDAANAAKAHGLGSKPTLVIIYDDDGLYHATISGNKDTKLTYFGTATGVYTVTAMDATNFYVGNAADYQKSCNSSARSYTFTAIK